MRCLWAAFAMAEELAKQKGYRYVFLFDEFQELDRLGGDLLLKNLRSIFQRQAHMLSATGGHPHGMMQVANFAYVAARLASDSTIDSDRISLVIGQVLRSSHSTFEEHWEEIRHIQNAPEIAMTIAEGGRPYALGIDAGRVSRVLRALQTMAMIEKHGRGDYRLVEPLFGRWLREKAGRKR